MRGAALVLALAMPLAAAAEIVEIKWLDGGFSQKSTIAPKKFLEVCGKLKLQETVQWQFQGSAPSDFNIHYHVGRDVSYPEQRKGIASASGLLSVPLDQDYCWMWSNRSTETITVELSLKRGKAAQ